MTIKYRLNVVNKINFSVCGVNSFVAKTYMRQKYMNVEYVGINEADYVIMTNRTLYSEKNQINVIYLKNF